jgi:hypothetical protein
MINLEGQEYSHQKEEKPWLERKFRDGKLFTISIDYIYDHICLSQRERLGPDADDWTVSKEFVIEELLDSGLSPQDLYPIRAALNPLREEVSVMDGITRLRVYKKRGIQTVRVKMYHG